MPKPFAHANWTRTLRKLRRYAAELQEAGFTVIEPAQVELPPAERLNMDDGPRRSGDHGLS